MIKQGIVARKDLKMPAGKLAAQVAHASLACILNKKKSSCKSVDSFNSGTSVNFDFTTQEYEWLTETTSSKFTKIVLRVNSEEELLNIHKEALKKGINCSLIKDAGDTVFKEETYTCVGIGPANSYILDNITGNLKLY